jgi:hypothetical protein
VIGIYVLFLTGLLLYIFGRFHVPVPGYISIPFIVLWATLPHYILYKVIEKRVDSTAGHLLTLCVGVLMAIMAGCVFTKTVSDPIDAQASLVFVILPVYMSVASGVLFVVVEVEKTLRKSRMEAHADSEKGNHL